MILTCHLGSFLKFYLAYNIRPSFFILSRISYSVGISGIKLYICHPNTWIFTCPYIHADCVCVCVCVCVSSLGRGEGKCYKWCKCLHAPSLLDKPPPLLASPPLITLPPTSSFSHVQPICSIGQLALRKLTLLSKRSQFIFILYRDIFPIVKINYLTAYKVMFPKLWFYLYNNFIICTWCPLSNFYFGLCTAFE